MGFQPDDEVAEGLGHPVDVALPEHAGLLVDEAALVLARTTPAA